MEKQIIQEQLLEYHPKMSLTVISYGRVINIGLDELVHIQKLGCEVMIHTDSSDYRTKYSLQDILNDLPVNDFFRINKSHIVSQAKMKVIGRCTIRIGERIVSISKYYKMHMIKRLGEILDRGYEEFRQV
jgi:DNA-binding LytR/AlgR family response regulator